MVLIDTSVWIDHFVHADQTLQNMLTENEAVIHPFVTGELACGNLKNRKEIFRLLNYLPSIQTITDEEYDFFIERHRLFETGLGFVDIHLLASALMSHCLIYTRDKILFVAANTLRIAYKNGH
ncbi:MAG: hypothetical protein A2487_07340 [Candidatus Raymondbacteria bacterium RifOxyC12_full_50_8]|uniref:PIN domain-containing protein n=1 Tax=Candidatus Raymondbacteria bacterium RIFOXYD12_FULL_49_13 TaxID=1817890 RepID=A0A1F7F3E0_UNCRA|nr:MAG: hypothetical protein A2248_08830 [Candidatus Raymondbacteria bacterium RIFOXYA2_FULL_49_16]OGJ96792.1 MAG: hypothetical protein A2487_07340 [Candidatus Raymondbacteria bacterium RifOxyC12_full_50_8]OGK01118.1 MAG: hypothetical protein A2519_20360 [Candidatus Raymondbacteria bacterium RIFOXYD12_FULL_49_13]OGP39339.1 MAG: hypothetical protein A2324_16870 [Candidatus Raymondbacteria bacterium RIFOXYB2_FULL_49_35]